MTAISMNADRPLWIYGPYLYDYHLYYRTSACDYWLELQRLVVIIGNKKLTTNILLSSSRLISYDLM